MAGYTAWMNSHGKGPSESQGGDEEPEGVVETVWNPGGDPAKLRAIAGAWRKMAGDLRQMKGDLDARAKTLESRWEGQAADGFHKTWQQLSAEIEDGAKDLDQIAGKLDETATKIEEINNEVHAIVVELGVTLAVGVATCWIPFAGALTAGRVAYLTGRIATLIGRLTAFLRTVAVWFRSLSVMGRLGVRFGADFLANLGAHATADYAAKGKVTISPMDLATFGFGSAGAVGVSSAAGATRLGTRLMRTRPMTSGAVLGGTGGAAGAYVAEGVRGHGWASPTTITNTAIGGMAGTVGGGLGAGLQSKIATVASSNGTGAGGSGGFTAGSGRASSRAFSGANPENVSGSTSGSTATADSPLVDANGTPLQGGSSEPVSPLVVPESPSGYSTSPGGLLAPDSPQGYSHTPSGLLAPDTPAGYSTSPGGLLAPDSPQGYSHTRSGLLAPDMSGFSSTSSGGLSAGVAHSPDATSVPSVTEGGQAVGAGDASAPAVGQQSASQVQAQPGSAGQTSLAERATLGEELRGATLDQFGQFPAKMRMSDAQSEMTNIVQGLGEQGLEGGQVVDSSAWTQPQASSATTVDSAGPGSVGGSPQPQSPTASVAPAEGSAGHPGTVRGGQTHTVAAGESLRSIAERVYGDPNLATAIERANPAVVSNPDIIHPGERLVLPAVTQPAPVPAGS